MSLKILDIILEYVTCLAWICLHICSRYSQFSLDEGSACTTRYTFLPQISLASISSGYFVRPRTKFGISLLYLTRKLSEWIKLIYFHRCNLKIQLVQLGGKKFWKMKICLGCPEIIVNQMRYLLNWSETNRGE